MSYRTKDITFLRFARCFLPPPPQSPHNMHWSHPIRFLLGLKVLAVKTVAGKLRGLFWNIYIQIWDLYFNIDNLISAKRDPRHVIPPGAPGFNGDWSLHAYLPPTRNDSRSCCPGLNTLANHGILPRDGKNISFLEINKAIQTAYNLSPSVSLNVLMNVANLFEKDYWKDRMSLSDFNAHNVIEHDGSILREDACFQPDQGVPSVDVINGLLHSASGTATIGRQRVKILTTSDLAAYTRQRRRVSKENNGQFSLKLIHKLFSAGNNAIMDHVFGGRVDDLRTWLIEERFPQGWQPRVLAKNGLSLFAFNKRSMEIYLMQDPLPMLELLHHREHHE